MFTIITTPKAFDGQFDAIQRNAITSWTRLVPRPEVILMGDDEGTAEVASELGASNIPSVERNHWGTPLFSSVLSLGQEAAAYPVVCYVNSDIMLMGDFSDAVQRIVGHFGNRDFMLVGRKTSIDLVGPWDFSSPSWDDRLRGLARDKGKYVTQDSDFFVFRRGMFSDVPPFAVGRCFWTQWLMYTVRQRGIPLIDATAVIDSIEPRHDYSHAISTGGAKRLSGPEYEANRRLFSGLSYFTTRDAPLVLTEAGIEASPWYYSAVSAATRLEYFVYFLLKGQLYPYSLPLVWMSRLARAGILAPAGLLPRRLRRSLTSL